MSSKITLKHGPGIPKKAGSTILAPGEPGWSTDLERLYVGTSDPQAPAMVGKPENFVNVRHHGAKGDGVTDDTAAVQAALSEAGRRKVSVFFPKGDYPVTTNDYDFAELEILGEGNDSNIVTSGRGIDLGNAVSNIHIADTRFSPINRKKPFNSIVIANPVNSVIIDRCTFNSTYGDLFPSSFPIKNMVISQCDINGNTDTTRTEKVVFNGCILRGMSGMFCGMAYYINCTWLCATTTVAGNQFDIRVFDGCKFEVDNATSMTRDYVISVTSSVPGGVQRTTIRDCSFDIKGRKPTTIIGRPSHFTGTADVASLDVSNIAVTGTVPSAIIDISKLTRLHNANIRTPFPRAKTKLLPNTASPHSVWEQHSDGVWYNNVKVA